MKKVACVLLASIVVCGCSTLKTERFAEVAVICNPEGAIASVNDVHKDSPATFKVVTNKDIDVSCQKSGYITSSEKVRTHITATGVLDAVGGFLFLVPAIGLISPGAWALDKESFEITLVKQPE